jgi:hypothetical protein
MTSPTATLASVESSLAAHIDSALVRELIDAYEEIKVNHYLGGHRLSAVEAGRFCEAVTRVLEQEIEGTATALAARLEVGKTLNRLEQNTGAADSLRLHIPRAIRVVYGIRNKRDTAHLTDGIDPNVQDSNLVVATCDWILAELVRRYHNVSPAEASRLIEDLVSRRVPSVQDFDGFLKVLDPTLSAGDHILLLLHQCGRRGASEASLREWSRPNMLANLNRTLRRLVDDKAWVHRAGDTFYITDSGTAEVTSRKLALPSHQAQQR